MSPFERTLLHHTAEITAYRFKWQNERIDERRELRLMALELKGLKGQAIKAAANIDRLNRAYGAFNEAAPAHAADVEGLTPQISALQDDLAFAAQVLGNSVGASNDGEKLKDTGAVKQVLTAADLARITGEPIVGQQTHVPSDRVALGPHPDVAEVEKVAPNFRNAV